MSMTDRVFPVLTDIGLHSEDDAICCVVKDAHLENVIPRMATVCRAILDFGETNVTTGVVKGAQVDIAVSGTEAALLALIDIGVVVVTRSATTKIAITVIRIMEPVCHA